jgi:cytochrome c-type biogenesis protein CcmH/NrfF
MRSLVLLTAAAALVALLGLAALTALRGAPPGRAEQAGAIAADLRCPDCQGLSVAESHTTAAGAIRAEIDEQLAAGRSADQVRQSFVDRYGEWILLAPTSPLPWLVPLVALLAGAGGLTWWLLRHPAAAAVERPRASVDDADRRIVHDEVESLDA